MFGMNIINEMRMPEHESAQCKVLVREDGTILLQSYQTIVCSISRDGWLDCSGTYSATTRKHIGWFMRLYGRGCGYYTAKEAYETQSVVNLETGEVLTYAEYNAMREKEKSEAVA